MTQKGRTCIKNDKFQITVKFSVNIRVTITGKLLKCT